MIGDRTEHPTYPNPTVAEALCHVDFELSSDSDWRISRPASLLQAVSSEYPNIEPVPNPAVTVSFDPSSPAAPKVMPAPPNLRLSSDDRKYYIAVGDKHYGFGHRAKYPGWQKFREGFLTGWEKFSDIARPREIGRISLRYVNIIPRTSEHRLLSNWIKATQTIPERLIETKSDPFLLRVESWIEADSLLMVTLAITGSIPGIPPILLDIERRSTVKMGATGNELKRHIETLHEDIWVEFASLRTPRLEEHLMKASS
jgi:uncharacterized protein (TIGR04255 family)